MSAVVVDEMTASRLPADARARLSIIPRPPGRPLCRPRRLEAESVIAVLDAAGPEAVVLVRPSEDDGDAALTRQIAELMGRRTVRLPSAPDAAAWVVGVAVAWLATGQDGLGRRLEVVSSVAEGGARLSTGAAAGARRPALRPSVLARWAGCVWRPCARCASGGLPGRCGGCGAAISVPA